MPVRTWCSEALREALEREGLLSVGGAFAYAGGQDLTKPGLGHRQRWRIVLTDSAGRRRELFMKRYGREPLLWRARRRWTYGRKRSPAGVELDNIVAAAAAGVPTIAEAACGAEVDRWGVRRSFIILAAVPGEALEQCAEGFLARRAGEAEQVAEFTRRLAHLVRRLHGAGFVHRDLYNCHVFLHELPDDYELRLIDLARAFRPRWRRFRWRVKDLAQLKYSMPAEWARAQWQLFLRQYLPEADASALRRWGRAIDRKVAFISRHDRSRAAARRTARRRDRP